MLFKPNGVLTKTSKTIILDPTKNGVGKFIIQVRLPQSTISFTAA